MFTSRSVTSPLERFPAKWTSVRVKKTRQNKKLEPCSDSIGTEKALVLLFEIGNDIGAILRALHLIEHLRAWHERSGIGQPTVQCRLVPGQAGILEGLGIVVALDDSGMTSDHATMAMQP